ncbi:MAG TPA: hypothetical protein VGP62_00720 [Bryobacteraceae bacterium]|nr:hypothetical protein [Bryobacteraceae bacterium]
MFPSWSLMDVRLAMLGWAIAFIMAAVLVALMGLGESASTLAAVTKVLFWVFILGFLASLAMHYNSTRA